MAKIIKFPRTLKIDAELVKMLQVSDELDKVILDALIVKSVDPREVAGLLAHRLGTLMRRLDSKDDLWEVCSRVARKQAALDQEA